MEAAKLVLEYLKVLVWPALLLGLLLWFRSPLKVLWKRLAQESRQVDLEIGGQKVSVKLAERVLDASVDAVLRSGSASAHAVAEIRNDARAVLEILSQLTDEDIQLIRTLPVPTANTPDRASAKLILLGLALRRAKFVEATATGQRVSALVGPTRDVDEALHKITQAM